ncbi:cytochrome P450 2K6 [Bombina bombina]|uniref:cytochrome P450 2K6 n=1 Tax=Bombina bombina TaxID=8345 RepID=UPI00235AD221|nr:cytochrome P450 2K6 [Bombina bombina]
MSFTYSIAVCFVFVVTVLYILNILSNHKKRALVNFPPGPKCLPLIGNLHILDLNKPHLTFLKLSRIYGPVFSIQMGMQRMVVLSGYETVKDALVNHADEFGERGRIPIFQDMDHGMGLTLSNGDNWKIMRRFTITTLRDFGMGKASIEENIIEECHHLIQHYESFKGKPFDNSLIMNASVANIIVAILLGHRMSYKDPVFLRLLKLTNENVRLLGSPMVSIYNMFPVLGFLPGSHKTIIKNVKELCDFIRTTFVNHLKVLDVNDQRSFIDAFLVRQKENEEDSDSYFHNENLTRLVRSLFAAGMDTTSTTLRWALLLMVKYRDIQEKVQEEIARVVGAAQPHYSHRREMPFTYAVIHEVQRFADILPTGVLHETAKDVNFRGYFIPKGTYVIPLLTSVLKDKTQFKNPETFDPNHFLDSEGNFITKEAFLPFSAGRRACAGETLARMELFIFFATLLQKFTFNLPPGLSDVDLSSAVGFTLTPLQKNICAIPRF